MRSKGTGNVVMVSLATDLDGCCSRPVDFGRWAQNGGQMVDGEIGAHARRQAPVPIICLFVPPAAIHFLAGRPVDQPVALGQPIVVLAPPDKVSLLLTTINKSIYTRRLAPRRHYHQFQSGRTLINGSHPAACLLDHLTDPKYALAYDFVRLARLSFLLASWEIIHHSAH